jgi:hypothetical protein
MQAHKPVIERETPHYFKCKDVKSNIVRTVKMTIRGITVLEDGTDVVVGHYNFRSIPDFHVGDKRENFYFTYDGPNGREKHEFKTKEVSTFFETVFGILLSITRARAQFRH